jgi:O-antigen/teichoic acid export membrane protein
MLNLFKHTLKHTAIYSIGNLGLKAIGLILLPLYTTHLTLSDYGELALLQVTSTLFVSFFSLQLSTAMMRWCSNEKNENEKKALVFTSFGFTWILVVVLNVLLVFFYGNLSTLFFGNSGYERLFKILFISASIEILNYFPFQLIRLKEKSLFYVIITAVRFSLILSLNVIFVAKMKMGIEGVLISQLIGQAVTLISTIPLLFRNMTFSLRIQETKMMIKFSFPLVFVSIATMLLSLGDRYIIKYILDYAEVGVYSLGFKIASVINMFLIQSFNIGFLPIAYKIFEKPEANRFFSKTLTYYTFTLVIFSFVISGFSREIITAIARNSEFYTAYKVVPLLCFPFILKGIQYIFALGLHFVKKTKYNAVIVGTISLLNIGLNLLFIPILGIYGAAISTIICWIIITILYYRITQRYYHVGYELKKILLLLIVFVVFTVIAFSLGDLKLLPRLGLKLLLFFLIPVVLIPFRFYEQIEVERIKGAWHKWKKIHKWPEYISRIKL